ncbi:MAG TPA: glycosyltransferase family 2 protein [Symbiobacteriaceae bacterium]|nr:glycosyltransferase family 2 protein [Symbiobacteriaceae bacterium]
MTRVQVLLSTYNGAAYLQQQLESLLAQDYPDISILIRDDGSSDSTPDILAQYRRHPFIRVIYGENIGVVRSFYSLLQQADPAVGYVALCDQDDVWLPGKVSRAVTLLDAQVARDVPGLYMGRYTIVDQDLNLIRQSDLPRRQPSIANALVENIAPGCTMVLNRPGLSILAGRLPGAEVPVHDWWFYMVIAGLGRVVYDAESHLLYRLHQDNAIGVERGFVDKWTRRTKRFFANTGLRPITRQAEELDRMYGHELQPESAAILRRVLRERSELLDRLAFAYRPPVYRQNVLDDLILRALLLCNQI